MAMRKIIIILLAATLVLAVDIMPLSKVKRGMKGYGLSVFSGEEPEKFGVEILGVLKNVGVDSSLIIARLTGKEVDHGGVISGMSGSPVFIDGKIVGSVSYGFQFSKEPIAGIVPIEEIIKGKQLPLTVGQKRFFYNGPLKKKLPFSFFLSKFNSSQKLGQFYPLPLPFFASVKGKFFDSFASRLNFVSASGAGKIIEPKIETESLEAGDAVSVLLTTGDVEISAGGTVVFNDKKKNKIYIFGHPFFNTGNANYFLAKAEVLGVVPSYSSPFKLMQPTKLVGRVVEDRLKGVVGETGKLPPYIPVRIKFFSSQKERKYNFWIIDDPLLAPALLMVAEQGMISEGSKDYGNISLKISGEIAIKNGQNVKISDIFTGKNSGDVIGLDAAILYYLENNPYKKAEIDSINIEMSVFEYEKSATIQRVWAPKYRVKPGEKLNITIYIKPKNQKIQEQTYPIKIPEVPSGEDLYLMVSSAEDILKWESLYYRGAMGFPASFDRLIRALNNLRKNNRLYFKFYTRKKSLFINGEEFPSLPPSLFKLFTSPFQPIKGNVLKRATVIEYTSELPWYIKGSTTIKFSTWSGL